MTDNSSSPKLSEILKTARLYAQMQHYVILGDYWEKHQNIAVKIPDFYWAFAEIFQSVGKLTWAQEALNQAGDLVNSSEQKKRQSLLQANLYRDFGWAAKSRKLYQDLIKEYPEDLRLWHGLLLSLEYDPAVSDQERYQLACQWGQLIESHTTVSNLNQSIHSKPRAERKLRVGYLSADFCQHTVGLFIKEIIKTHDVQQFQIFTYYSRALHDRITEEIAASSVLRHVEQLSDEQLWQVILSDELDILVDLSGHTGGTRLSVMAQRLAPVQLSYLGYFATTGLSQIDGVILDSWSVTPATQNCFKEKILTLPNGRLVFSPPSFAPEVKETPAQKKGYVTFGSFNNTNKLNEGVLDVWARVLLAVPESHLLLKWRTFNDPHICQNILGEFSKRGVEVSRVELRPATYHVDMLAEYGDIDIALDPFPFTGGMTSCEALWMGVPVITWPQSRVVSRQTYAILQEAGLPSNWVANSEDDYVEKAAQLASDLGFLMSNRSQLRQKVMESRLCQPGLAAKDLEKIYLTI